MDGQLEICGRGYILEQRVFDGVVSGARYNTATLHYDKMATAGGEAHHRHNLGGIGFQRASGEDATRSFYSGFAKLHLNHDPDRYFYRHVVCSVSALPILCIYCLGDPVPSLEEWLASNSAVWILGGAGMGLECLSEYGCQLHGSCWKLSGDCCECMVGYEEGLRCSQGGWRGRQEDEVMLQPNVDIRKEIHRDLVREFGK